MLDPVVHHSRQGLTIMKLNRLVVPMLVLAAGLLGAATASAGGIVMKQLPNGDMVLTNVSDDDPAAAAPAAPRQGSGDAKGAAKDVPVRTGPPFAVTPAAAAAAQGSGPTGATIPDAPKDPTTPSARYLETMLNAPLLPNGMSTNPAAQRRYMMIKKSDFIPGN